MLSEIHISALGVIDDAMLELADGLTVVTGETGAGKTMIVAGLSLLFGGKADPGRVRPGHDRAVIEGRITLNDSNVAKQLVPRLTELGAQLDDDDTLVAARTILAEGRSRAHMGGRAVPAGVLTEFGDILVAIHGQSDQLRLLRPAQQRAALDRFGGDELLNLVDQCRLLYRQWRQVSLDLADRVGRARQRKQEADVLRYGLAEIEAAQLTAGEDLELRAEVQRLAHAEQLRAAAFAAHQALAGDPALDSGVDTSTLLGTTRRVLDEVSVHDERLQSFSARAAELSVLATDLAADLASYTESVESDPIRLAAVQERQSTISALVRKYGDDVAGVLAWADSARAQLAALDTSEEVLTQLRQRQKALTGELTALVRQLSRLRSVVAHRFSEQVSVELRGLAMPHAQVIAVLSHRHTTEGQSALEIDGELIAVGPDGVDEVELRLIPHPGAPPLALQRGASGGELSRIMLAVEVVFAGASGTATMVFDEVDAGVGGKAAVEVGRRLARLARSHQVLAVTHLPQVAAFADRHLVVIKDSNGAVTKSGVRLLDESDRPRELARMLAGIDDSKLGIAHAQELLELARSDRGRS